MLFAAFVAPRICGCGDHERPYNQIVENVSKHFCHSYILLLALNWVLIFPQNQSKIYGHDARYLSLSESRRNAVHTDPRHRAATRRTLLLVPFASSARLS